LYRRVQADECVCSSSPSHGRPRGATAKTAARYHDCASQQAERSCTYPNCTEPIGQSCCTSTLVAAGSSSSPKASQVGTPLAHPPPETTQAPPAHCPPPLGPRSAPGRACACTRPARRRGASLRPPRLAAAAAVADPAAPWPPPSKLRPWRCCRRLSPPPRVAPAPTSSRQAGSWRRCPLQTPCLQRGRRQAARPEHAGRAQH
jgi:hypothetical protein